MSPSRRRQSPFVTIATVALSLPIAMAFVAAQAQIQAPAPTLSQSVTPVYDVMSIKLNKSGSNATDIDSEVGRFSAKNVSLKALLAEAFDLDEDLISGLSGPIQSARFDVEAKVVAPNLDLLKKMSREQSHAMLLPLVTERFQLKLRTEIKTLPIYGLVLAKGGPKFKSSADQKNSNGDMDVNGSRTRATISGQSVTMRALAKALSTRVDRVVSDKTGLTGNFDLKLEWSKVDIPDSGTDVLPGIFTALPEQLGLKLQPAKGPVETLVIDHADMPSEN